jgi:AcrR family transcriptional regulator
VRLTTTTGKRGAILAVARDIVTQDGIGALTYEAVARRLGVTKQAVIYWFPTKQDLYRELAVPALRAEAEAVIAAMPEPGDAGATIRRAVEALVAFHISDLDRFRQIYLAIQLDPKPERLMPQDALRQHVHPVTSAMYSALEAALDADPRFRAGLCARRAAVTIHMAALGLVLMTALGSALKDPLAHATHDLANTMIRLLVEGARE